MARRNILVFLFGDIGDTLLAMPALHALREHLSTDRLVVLCKTPGARLIEARQLADDTIIIDKHLFDHPRSLFNPLALWRVAQLVRRLHRERFDTVVIMHHLVTRWGAAKFAMLSLATGASHRLGIDNGRGWFLTESVTDRGFGAVHEAEYCLEVARLLGAEGKPTLLSVVQPDDRARAAQLLVDAEVRGPFIAIHPGTGWFGPGRQWMPNRFAEAAMLVSQRRPMPYVVVGTAHDAPAAQVVLDRLGSGAIDLVGKTSVGELGAVLERAAVLLANDGGVAHVAASVGTPVVTIFGPSNDRAWRPLTGEVVAVDLGCRPCFYRDLSGGTPLGCATRECLLLVTPRMVADAAIRCMRDVDEPV